MPRRDLTPSELECTENLRRLWLEIAKDKGISQKKLADEWGVSQATVCQYLGGHIPLNANKKIAFAKALGVDVSDIDNSLSSVQCEKVPLLIMSEVPDWTQGLYMQRPRRRWTHQPIPCPKHHSSKTFALTVEGDAMVPPNAGVASYPSGTIIFVDPSVKPFSGCKVIAEAPSGELTFKTYVSDAGRTFLMCLNPAYPAIEITEMDLKIYGVVIGHWVDD